MAPWGLRAFHLDFILEYIARLILVALERKEGRGRVSGQEVMPETPCNGAIDGFERYKNLSDYSLRELGHFEFCLK